MAVRLGIDVGGTFTKAVAVDTDGGAVVARAIVPTSHGAADGIAAGVVEAILGASAVVTREGRGPIVMVGHSTSLAVNALLEGDMPRVGLVGIGRAPDLGAARRRTDVGRLDLAPGRILQPIYRFVDASSGLGPGDAGRVVDELAAAGATSIAVSEAFSVEDPRGELAVLAAAADRGLPACAGHQLTGILGLELRTVSALVNAAILPRAAATARVVAEGLAAAGITAPLVVLRGDGGATDLAGFTALPIRSLFSGPAASVAGALHHLSLDEGIMLEVGGTSTNIALVRGGRPRLAYVRVGGYATALRALDVWVAGVAGGSLARAKRRGIAGVGPRSAHIAGLRYASFASPDHLADARAELMAPRAGDPPDYLVIDAAGGRFGLTVTCAANALGQVPTGDYAAGYAESARLAFTAAGRLLGTDGLGLATRMLDAAVAELSRPLKAAVASAGADTKRLEVVGVGGGSGALVPALARAIGRPGRIASNAEILSSIGAASSLIQAVHEATAAADDPTAVPAAIRAAEAAAIAAGAAPALVETTTEFDATRGTIRAIATGALPMEAGTGRTSGPLGEAALRDRAAAELGVRADALVELGRTSHYRAFGPASTDGRSRPGQGPRPWSLLDLRGAIAHAGQARAVLAGAGPAFAAQALDQVRRSERQVGPTSVAPPVVIVSGRRLVDCSPLTGMAALLRAVGAELSGPDPVIVAIEAEGAR